MANLARMGKEEDIAFVERTFTANSHKALLLAEAVTEAGSDRFEALNEALFRAYFGEGKNIGDVDVIRKIADETGIPRDTVESAWSDPRYEERLKRDNAAASRIGITGIPTFIIAGKWIIEGAVPLDMLRKVVQEADVAS